MLFHAEPIRRNGKMHGYIRAASYGHTLGGAVGLAMIENAEPIARSGSAGPRSIPEGNAESIDAKWIEAGTWEVEIAGKLYPAVASLKPFYDPENKRVKL
jgi:4-methylaminobutanoate oxidase (formaldehyde-forming)